MNVIIDPYLFELDDENEIKSALSFFRMVCFLCKSKRISIYLYKNLVERMLEREVKPFPIFLGRIKDEDLRAQVQFINNMFVNVVMNCITPIDIEECGGGQEYKVVCNQPLIEERLEQDAKYFELLCVLLRPCYDKTIEISPCIMSAEVGRGVDVGVQFIIKCGCENVAFQEKYRFGLVDEFAKDDDRAFLELNRLNASREIPYVKSPVVVYGQHHNKLQSNSRINSYEGLSRANKSVISLLRYFGLSKIILGEFHEDSARARGTIDVCGIKRTTDYDILDGWLFAETGFKYHVDLYFPPKVGEHLWLYLKSEFDKNNVQRLVDAIF